MKSFAKRVLEKPEKIVCIGLGKTGTTTFAKAMQILGYRHKSQGHGFAFENRYTLPIRWTIWRYDSFDDFPWPYLYIFIKKYYPKAKFILTRRRDTDTWFNSLQAHYCRHGPSYNMKLFYGYSSPFENERHHRMLYESHNERIRDFFGGDPNFLEVCWEEGHGWQELCGFLGRSIPVGDFPFENRANDTKDIATD